MRIVTTLMIRDEADIVGAMLTHQREQGVDHVIVTDNASVDGTVDLLRTFERQGFVTLWHDPEHRKQQYRVVTRMARHAATELGADWVINADADEFMVARDPGRTIRDVLAAVPPSVDVLRIPVVNLTGAPSRVGSGLARLDLRDQRSESELTTAGIPFHPTPNAVHRGHPEVEIAQGNHRAEAPGWGAPVDALDAEVLHLPWRSWKQYSYKVRVSGEAYLANPELAPSPRHHGMQDFRRLQQGRLESTYVAKHPTAEEAAEGIASGAFAPETRLAHLEGPLTPGFVADERYGDAEQQSLSRLGRQFRAVELAGELEAARIQAAHDMAVEQRDAALADNRRLNEELAGIRRRKVVRLTDKVARGLRRPPHDTAAD
jgi:hypothetical protein